MAEDDPYDYAFGQFPDVNPPGTMTSLGLKPDDPLNEWGRNIKPADLAQYVHDPQGFMNNMANQGVPPPDHHYTRGLNGDLQAYDPATGQPVRMTGGRIQGNLSDYLGPSAAQAVAPPGRPSSALGFSSEPPPRPEDTAGTPSQRRPIPPTQTVPPSGPLAPGSEPILGEPKGPLAPIGKAIREGLPKFDWGRGGGGEGGAALNPPEYLPEPKPLPKLRNPSPVLENTTPLPRPRPGAPEPAELPPIPQTEAQPGSTPAERAREKKDKVEPLSGEAMSNFAKSLQGVKMPQRPNWQPMGAPAVRSPVGIQPQIQTLLAAIGQGRPSPQQTALMRLLGRA